VGSRSATGARLGYRPTPQLRRLKIPPVHVDRSTIGSGAWIFPPRTPWTWLTKSSVQRCLRLIDSTDPETNVSLRELCRLAGTQRTIVLWIGAGASRWAGYPSWVEVAKFTHKGFIARAIGYDAARGHELLTQRAFPELFELCSAKDRQLYLSLLAECLAPHQSPRLYTRFIDCLKAISPLYIVTTNVDEALEQAIGSMAATIQNTDLERLAPMLTSHAGFIAKLHGSMSQLNSLVFTTSEYQRMVSSGPFHAAVRNLFYNSSVVFFGYGLADEYVVNFLRDVDNDKVLFGDGPHFVVSNTAASLPPSVRRILYSAVDNTDHRSAIQVLDEIRLARQRIVVSAPEASTPAQESPKSAHLLSEIIPPGTWQSSVTLQLTRKEDGALREAIVGEGWSADEIGTPVSMALHDLVVGLLCFDTVFAPISALAKILTLIGEAYFGELIASGSLRLVHWVETPAVIFSKGGLTGDLNIHRTLNPDGTEVTVSDLIRRNLQPLPGKEAEAEGKFGRIIETTLVVTESSPLPLPDAARGLLIRPSVKRLLGLSEGLPPGVVPRWSVFPALRLTRLIQLARTCEREHIASLHIQYGMPELVGPVFAATNGDFWAEQAARFVLSGRFDTDLGAYVQTDTSVIGRILKFRDTEEGGRLRKEVLARIGSVSEGDIATSINGGLKSVIPFDVLQRARNKMAGLLTPSDGAANGALPAVWNDLSYGRSWLDRWKSRSLTLLEKLFSERGLTRNAACPCGSGDSIKECCRATLRGST
jgi:hypothetical protein